MFTLTTTRTESTAVGTRRNQRLLIVAAATVAPALVTAVARVLGVELTVTMPSQAPMTIGLPMVLIAALLSSTSGWATLALLERITRRARAIWVPLAVVVLILSLGPVLQVDTSAATRATLAVMHVAVAAVLVPGLIRAGRHYATQEKQS
jgi:hypothetical protein